MEFNHITLKEIAFQDRPWLITRIDEIDLTDISVYSIGSEQVIGFKMVFRNENVSNPKPVWNLSTSLDTMVKMCDYSEIIREKKLKEIGI